MITRIDGIDKYYISVETLEKILFPLLLITIFLSFTPLLSKEIQTFFDKKILTIIFVISTVLYFVISQYLRFVAIPQAERMRRKQLLSNAYNTPLIHERTHLYYNNDYTPSTQRLGANILENALFSKTITQKMLKKTRSLSFAFMLAWIGMVIYKNSDFDFVMSITQLVFSGSIVINWINLEILNHRFSQVYTQLYNHFLHDIGDQSVNGTAAILDAFTEYESAKASAGVKLNSKIFFEQNPVVTQEWEEIKQTLHMQQDVTAS